MGIGEILIAVFAVGFVLAVVAVSRINKARRKGGCCDCSCCPHGASCLQKARKKTDEK